MLFTHDTEVSLAETAALVNTYDSYDERDDLVTPADFEAFLARNPYSGEIRRTPDELEAVRALRPRLRELWTAADRDRAAGLVGSRYVVRTWTFLMAIAAGLVGVALVVGRMSGRLVLIDPRSGG